MYVLYISIKGKIEGTTVNKKFKKIGFKILFKGRNTRCFP